MQAYQNLAGELAQIKQDPSYAKAVNDQLKADATTDKSLPSIFLIQDSGESAVMVDPKKGGGGFLEDSTGMVQISQPDIAKPSTPTPSGEALFLELDVAIISNGLPSGKEGYGMLQGELKNIKNDPSYLNSVSEALKNDSAGDPLIPRMSISDDSKGNPTLTVVGSSVGNFTESSVGPLPAASK